MASSTVEDYVKRIYLEQEGRGGLVPMGDLVAAMGVAPGTATAMVKSLAADRLVRYEPYVGVRLTAKGRRQALAILRRHRLVELFLVQVLGMDWAEVHEDAERLEHAVSDRVLAAIDRHLDHPAKDPHGDPIPDADGRIAGGSAVTLAESAPGAALEVVRITDQSPPFLRAMAKRGLRPGAGVRVAKHNEAAGTVDLDCDGTAFTLGRAAAREIRVRRV